MRSTWSTPGKFRFHPLLATLLALATVATLIAPASAHGHGPKVTTVAEGLAGPLGLAVDGMGTVYVGESFAGLLTRIDRHGNRSTVVEDDGPDFYEVAGVALGPLGGLSWVETYYEAPADPDGEPGPALASNLAARLRNGTEVRVASLFDFEASTNPDGTSVYGFQDLDPACAATLPDFIPPGPYEGVVDSHPYALARTLGGWVVAEAAGNAILHVSWSGRVRTVAVLPPVPQVVTDEIAAENGLDDCVIGETYVGEPVPTDVEIGKDGHYYVTTLPGSPEAPGAGALWRVNRHTGKVRLIADGFSGAVDLAIARDGTMYVAELFADRISKVDRHGRVRTYVSIPMPGAVEFRPNGKGPLYATSGVFGPGSVVKIG